MFAVYPVFLGSQLSSAPWLCCDLHWAGAESLSLQQRPKAVLLAVQVMAIYQLPWAWTLLAPFTGLGMSPAGQGVMSRV